MVDLKEFKKLIDKLPLQKRITHTVLMSIQAYGSNGSHPSLEKFSKEVAEFIMVDIADRIKVVYPEVDVRKL